MKKLLSIIGSIGLMVTATTTLIACGTEQKTDELVGTHQSFEEISQMTNEEVKEWLDDYWEWPNDPNNKLLFDKVNKLIQENATSLPDDVTQEQFDYISLRYLEFTYITFKREIDESLTGKGNPDQTIRLILFIQKHLKFRFNHNHHRQNELHYHYLHYNTY